MKKIKTLLILGAILLIGFAGKSQVGITYRMNNYMVVPGTTYDTLIFDVEAKGTPGTSYTTTFTIKINFNSAAFGVSAVPVVVQQLPLSIKSGYNFNTLAITAGTSRFATTFFAQRQNFPFSGTYDIDYLSNLTTSYQGVVRYKMLITGPGNPLNVDFYKTGSGSMQSGQNYVLASGGTTTTAYTPILFDFTPATGMLIFSEIADPSNTTTNFVEIYNPGGSAVNFNYYPWYLNAGASSVQLTGSIAAGGTYVVGYNNTDFEPDLVSTIIGTGGATFYQLSFYGNYVSGNITDVYDGSVTGIDFAGKHAVRHYNIMAPNLTFTGSEWVVSAAQDIDMTPGSHRSTLTWDGVPNEEWRSKANWAEGFIPDAGHNVSIPNAGAVPVVSNGDNAYAHDLAITGSLIIQSDATLGDGSLITYGTVTGTASVERYLAADRYWYVTQPVTEATANVFLNMWLFTYTGGAWSPFIYDETTDLIPMQGYAVWTSSINSYDPPGPILGSFTTSYDGVLNTGAISRSLEYAVDLTYGNGWNFVGNPYPSAVDWEADGWTKTNLDNDAYSAFDGATYGTYTAGSGGTNGTTQFIPAAQGFFVQTDAAGTLGVTDAVRAHDAIPFWKSQENMLNRLSLTISNGEINDETVIYFNEEATTELDYSFDARKLMAVASPQAYTMLANDRMAINTFNNTTETQVVTMGVNAPEAGEYTITASNLESFDVSIPVYLEDLETGGKINLREMSSYSFTAGEGTSERFKVHFAAYQGIGDQPSTNISGIYAVNNNIYVDFNGVRGEIAIYNILGQEVSHSVASNGLNMVSVPQGNAVYIVKVISDNTTVTKKVFVK